MIELFAVLLIAGLLLVGAEVFIPGGILGVIGGAFLLGAILVGFSAFGPVTGSYVAIGIVVLVGLVIALWIKFFPSSPIGRRMTVSKDLRDSKGTETGLSDLIGQSGETLSRLRPSGFAMIGTRRVDVVTEGGMIARGERIRVIEVEGNRVVVEQVTSE